MSGDLVDPSDATAPRSQLWLAVAPGCSWSSLGGTEISPCLWMPFPASPEYRLGTSVKIKDVSRIPLI